MVMTPPGQDWKIAKIILEIAALSAKKILGVLSNIDAKRLEELIRILRSLMHIKY